MRGKQRERPSVNHWDFVRQMREEWTEEDWKDFFLGIDFALWKIAQRHKKKPQDEPIDFQI